MPDSFAPQHEFLVAIDSDGCVFDSMEIKHKECFCPQFIKHYRLQRVAKYAREAWEFVNLYSKSRGANRFIALRQALELIRARPETSARGLELPAFSNLYGWMDVAPKLGNPDLHAAVDAAGDPELAQAYAWSLGVNAAIADLVKDVPPFPSVRPTLDALPARADAIVVSQTPCEALEREWAEHRIADAVAAIAGQEMGTKTDILARATKGRYAPERVLMIGDAPGDLKAARANGTLFFPILPGDEESSWQRLRGEGLDRFFAGTYAGAYEAERLREFDALLPEKPAWTRT